MVSLIHVMWCPAFNLRARVYFCMQLCVRVSVLVGVCVFGREWCVCVCACVCVCVCMRVCVRAHSRLCSFVGVRTWVCAYVCVNENVWVGVE